jgi:predicted glycoside hydrolase/deacetylase ChbG (UPF0249 family)
MKRLIVNADDFGRTPGINAGTLHAHERGIVTSVTVMVLEPAAEEGIREAVARAPGLSIGLHFALTGGGPPAAPVMDLLELAPGGHFPRTAEDLPHRLPDREVRQELEAQLARFERFAGRPPTHLDSHHHAALHASVQRVFSRVARERGLPVRAANDRAREQIRMAGAATPDHFLEDFYGEGATLARLKVMIANLPEGTSELMCHPGYADEDLIAGSSYARERDEEVRILTDPSLRPLLAQHGVSLIGFREL